MKVKQLIEKLQQLDPEAMVVRGGYDGGFDEVAHVNDCEVLLNVNDEDEWFKGRHELIYMETPTNVWIDAERYTKVKGVFIG